MKTPQGRKASHRKKMRFRLWPLAVQRSHGAARTPSRKGQSGKLIFDRCEICNFFIFPFPLA
jgi:hypothetical protein